MDFTAIRVRGNFRCWYPDFCIQHLKPGISVGHHATQCFLVFAGMLASITCICCSSSTASLSRVIVIAMEKRGFYLLSQKTPMAFSPIRVLQVLHTFIWVLTFLLEYAKSFLSENLLSLGSLYKGTSPCSCSTCPHYPIVGFFDVLQKRLSASYD